MSNNVSVFGDAFVDEYVPVRPRPYSLDNADAETTRIWEESGPAIPYLGGAANVQSAVDILHGRCILDHPLPNMRPKRRYFDTESGQVLARVDGLPARLTPAPPSENRRSLCREVEKARGGVMIFADYGGRCFDKSAGGLDPEEAVTEARRCGARWILIDPSSRWRRWADVGGEDVLFHVNFREAKDWVGPARGGAESPREAAECLASNPRHAACGTSSFWITAGIERGAIAAAGCPSLWLNLGGVGAEGHWEKGLGFEGRRTSGAGDVAVAALAVQLAADPRCPDELPDGKLVAFAGKASQVATLATCVKGVGTCNLEDTEVARLARDHLFPKEAL